MINVFIDEITPCLSDAKTGELVQTEVIQITRKSFLKSIIRKMDGIQTGINLSMITKFMLSLWKALLIYKDWFLL